MEGGIRGRGVEGRKGGMGKGIGRGIQKVKPLSTGTKILAVVLCYTSSVWPLFIYYLLSKVLIHLTYCKVLSLLCESDMSTLRIFFQFFFNCFAAYE